MTLPGDVRPPLLAQPPGDRYATSAPVPVMERPRLGRAIGLGVVAALLVAAACAVLRGILDLTVGIIAVAVAGGWVIGAAVRQGAWAGQPHVRSSVPVISGAVLGALCWLAGLMGAWLVAMAILPASSRTFMERLAALPFLEWLNPQLGLADFAALVLFAVFGAIGARSGSTQA